MKYFVTRPMCHVMQHFVICITVLLGRILPRFGFKNKIEYQRNDVYKIRPIKVEYSVKETNLS